MWDLDERLRVTARHATDGLDLDDPSEDGVVLTVPERRPRRRRQLLRASVAATAAAAAVLGVVVWNGADDTTLAPAAGDGTAAGQDTASPPDVVTATPSQRLRAALDATLATDRFQVRTVTVVPEPGERMQSSSDRSVLPTVVGSGDFGDVVQTVDGPLVAMSWTAGAAAAIGTSVIRDSGAATTSWQVAPGQWQRATMAEPSLIDQLRNFASAACAVTTSGGDPSSMEVTIAGDDASSCADGGAAALTLRDRWTVTLRPDGRIDHIAPVRDVEPYVAARSELRFGYDDLAVLLPDPSSVTDVPAPEGSYTDSATGFTKPMYTKG